MITVLIVVLLVAILCSNSCTALTLCGDDITSEGCESEEYEFMGRSGWKDVVCNADFEDCFNKDAMIGNYTCGNSGNCNCGAAYNCYCKNQGNCNCGRSTNCYGLSNGGDIFGECTDNYVFCGSSLYTCNCGSAKYCSCGWPNPLCPNCLPETSGTVNYNKKTTELINCAFSDDLNDQHDVPDGGSTCWNGGRIAGLVIGLIFAFALLIAFCYWCRKRRQSIAASQPTVVTIHTHSSVVPEQPYNSGSNTNIQYGHSQPVQVVPVTAFSGQPPFTGITPQAHSAFPSSGMHASGYPFQQQQFPMQQQQQYPPIQQQQQYPPIQQQQYSQQPQQFFGGFGQQQQGFAGYQPVNSQSY